MRREGLLAVLVLAAVWATQFAHVAPTNFTATDEWLYLSLTSRGIVDAPHMQRPLALLWALPGAALPHRFAGFHLADGAYMLLTGGLVFLLVRRLGGGDPRLALLAGTFALVWAPRDMNRMVTVQATLGNGPTAATLLVLLLVVESWRRRSVALLVLSSVVAIVTLRSYEAAAPLMAAGPLLVVWMAGVRSPSGWRWAGAFGVVLLAALGVIAFGLRRPDVSYQFALGFDPRPPAVLGRLAMQFGFHLLPLFTPPPALGAAGVLVAVAVFGLGYGLVAAASRPVEPPPRRRLAGLAALGLAMAALGYLPFCLLSSIQSATRTQFFSGPGIALLLAAAAAAASSLLPARARALAAGVLGAWVVAFGTGNTIAMQRLWTGISSYPAQTSALSQLTARAPDLRPHTLLVLVDEPRAFPAIFTFRHAVGYLYEGRAAGIVWEGSDYLYSFAFDAGGVRLEPWPAVRKPWRDEPALYGYDELVVARLRADRQLALLREWPPELPALPPAARYDPESRIVRGGASVAAQRVLYEYGPSVNSGLMRRPQDPQ